MCPLAGLLAGAHLTALSGAVSAQKSPSEPFYKKHDDPPRHVHGVAGGYVNMRVCRRSTWPLHPGPAARHRAAHARRRWTDA